MIRVSKVIVEQYSPYLSRQDQLPSGGEAPQHPIHDYNKRNREHLGHSMINKRNCEYTLPQEHAQ